MKRDPMADEQIKTARGDEETPELDEADRFAESAFGVGARCYGSVDVNTGKTYRTAKVDHGRFGLGPEDVSPVMTEGATPTEMSAFVALRRAAREAHAAQQSMTTTSTALREAFGAFCKAVTE